MTSLSPKIGVCESRFSTVLKPHRHNPDCRDVTAIGKGHGSIPRRTQPTWWAFSRSLFCSWLHELPSWRAPSHYWWASTLVCRQDAGEKERTPVCSARHMFLVISPPVSCSSYQLEEVSTSPSAAAWSLCSLLCLPPLSFLSLWWSPVEMKQRVKLSKLNYLTFKGADINLYAMNFTGHAIAARIKNTKDGGLLTSSTLWSLWQLKHIEQASIAPLRRTSF